MWQHHTLVPQTFLWTSSFYSTTRHNHIECFHPLNKGFLHSFIHSFSTQCIKFIAHIQDNLANCQRFSAQRKVIQFSSSSSFVSQQHTSYVYCINGLKSLQILIYFFFLTERHLRQIHFWLAVFLYRFRSIRLLFQSTLMSGCAAGGHLLMLAAIRGRRAAVKALDRRVAEPHSMAFSCRAQWFRTFLELSSVLSKFHQREYIHILSWTDRGRCWQVLSVKHIMSWPFC